MRHELNPAPAPSTTVPTSSPFVRKLELAKLLGVTTRTISTYTKDHGLPVHHVNGTPYFVREEVSVWLASRAYAPVVRNAKGDPNGGDDATA